MEVHELDVPHDQPQLAHMTMDESREISSTELKALTLSLRFFEKFSKLLGNSQVSETIKSTANALKWLAIQRSFSKGAVKKKITDGSIGGSPKEEADFWRACGAAVGLVVIPLKLAAKLDDHVDRTGGFFANKDWNIYFSDAAKSESKSLSEAHGIFRGAAKPLAIEAAMERIRSLGEESTSLERNLAYLQLTKSVLSVAIMISNVIGISPLTATLGLFSVLASSAQLYGDSIDSHSATEIFKEMHQMATELLKVQFLEFEESIKTNAKFDPLVRQILLEDLKLDQQSFLGYLCEARNEHQLMKVLRSYQECCLNTLHDNGIPTTAQDGELEALLKKCQAFSDELVSSEEVRLVPLETRYFYFHDRIQVLQSELRSLEGKKLEKTRRNIENTVIGLQKKQDRVAALLSSITPNPSEGLHELAIHRMSIMERQRWIKMVDALIYEH